MLPSRNGALGSASAPAVAKRGQITVKSTPSHAGVTVNGTWRGRTPLTLDSLPFGNYVVRVGTAGLQAGAGGSCAERAEPVAGAEPAARKPKGCRPSDITTSRPAAAAKPVTFTGTLFVDSHPQGATVVIDGKPVGKTPLRLTDMRIGTHVVRLELARHRPWYRPRVLSPARKSVLPDRSRTFSEMKAILALENGTWYKGEAAGAPGEAGGEVVFNTGMTGYQEVLTDPSYAGQIVCMTAPQIGNYGIAPEDEESRGTQVAGFIIRDESPIASNWRAEGTIRDYLTRNNIVAITPSAIGLRARRSRMPSFTSRISSKRARLMSSSRRFRSLSWVESASKRPGLGRAMEGVFLRQRGRSQGASVLAHSAPLGQSRGRRVDATRLSDILPQRGRAGPQSRRRKGLHRKVQPERRQRGDSQ